MWWSQHKSCKNERQLEYSDLHKQTALGGNSEYGFSHNSEWCIIFLEQQHSTSHLCKEMRDFTQIQHCVQFMNYRARPEHDAGNF